MITFFITGGTIDGIDYKNESEAPKNPKSNIPDFLKQVQITEPCVSEILFLKDSRFVNDNDRSIIADKCATSSSEHIIVTHGSFTMVKTATYLAHKQLPKTIVLVGSKTPATEPQSDALQNLRFAVEEVQKLSHGVYIVMQSRIFNWDNARKNLSTGEFEELK
ncbi:MAG: asparaginase domain-containing protein [Patescibacteria group bacterium]